MNFSKILKISCLKIKLYLNYLYDISMTHIKVMTHNAHVIALESVYSL